MNHSNQLDLLATIRPTLIVAKLPNGRVIELLDTPPKPEIVYPSDRYVLAKSNGWTNPHIVDRRFIQCPIK